MKFLLNRSIIHVVVLYSKTRNFVANCFFLGNTKFDVLAKRRASPGYARDRGFGSSEKFV